jgi:hypothetical protein
LATEESYRAMVLDKTGGLFRLAVGLMQAFSENEKKDYTSLLNSLGLYFQIRDDYVNISRYLFSPACPVLLLSSCPLLLPHVPSSFSSPISYLYLMLSLLLFQLSAA